MPPIPDLVHEYLDVEKNFTLNADDRVKRLTELMERIRELRPLIDPMLLIGRYRPSLG